MRWLCDSHVIRSGFSETQLYTGMSREQWYSMGVPGGWKFQPRSSRLTDRQPGQPQSSMGMQYLSCPGCLRPTLRRWKRGMEKPTPCNPRPGSLIPKITVQSTKRRHICNFIRGTSRVVSVWKKCFCPFHPLLTPDQDLSGLTDYGSGPDGDCRQMQPCFRLGSACHNCP